MPAVIPVDLLGKCVDYGRLEALADDHGTRLLCDAAESVGATWQGRPAGSFGDAAVLSFNGNKIMTTSGGGMLLTDDEPWPRTCASCRRRPVSLRRTTSTPRSATTTDCPTSWPHSAGLSWCGWTR